MNLSLQVVRPYMQVFVNILKVAGEFHTQNWLCSALLEWEIWIMRRGRAIEHCKFIFAGSRSIATPGAKIHERHTEMGNEKR